MYLMCMKVSFREPWPILNLLIVDAAPLKIRGKHTMDFPNVMDESYGEEGKNILLPFFRA